jgi:pyruvate/2-oxoglutarate dehydrogenase complex dihydrolipoamide acyltransferase (E2) component
MDEVIAQIETDKVTIDIKAPSAGVLQKLMIKAADTVVPGQVRPVHNCVTSEQPASTRLRTCLASTALLGFIWVDAQYKVPAGTAVFAGRRRCR